MIKLMPLTGEEKARVVVSKVNESKGRRFSIESIFSAFKKCPDCNSKKLKTTSLRETYCKSCGFVIA